MCVLCLELKQKYCERIDRTEKMPKKDTKLQKLSESIQYTIEEMRGLGIEGLDQLFLEIYMEEAEQLTDSRQQTAGKSKTFYERCHRNCIFCCSGRK